MNFSYYNAPISNLKPAAKYNLKNIYCTIKNDNELARLTDQYRSYAVPDSKKAEFKKQYFPYVTFSGLFNVRSDKSMLTYSGFVCVDCDDLTVSELETIKNFACNDKYVLLGFTSPSMGYKLIVRSASQEAHSSVFNAYRQHISKSTGVEIKKLDSSCINLSRACFICHDYYAYINELVLNEKIDQVPIIDYQAHAVTKHAPMSESMASIDTVNADYVLDYNHKDLEVNFKALVSVNEKREGKYGSPREPWIQKLASLCNHFGMQEKKATEYMIKYFAAHPESLNPQKPIDVQKYLVQPVQDTYSRYADQFDTWEEVNKIDQFDTPLFPDHIFTALPSFLKKLCLLYNDRRERDMVFLTCLTVLSSCFPNYWSIYDNRKYCANLFLFISAPASSGKGRISAIRNLGNALQKRLDETYCELYKEYEEELAAYKSKDSDSDFRPEMPTKPYKKLLFIPANNTAPRLIERLMRNINFGIVMDTEADTFKQSFKSEHGNYSDILRKAFQHEAVSSDRKTNDELNHIENAFLSTIVSGTPNQAKNLIHSVENGLLSRFIFYSFNSVPKWKDVFVKMDVLPEDYCSSMSVELLAFIDGIHAFEGLSDDESGIEFVLKGHDQQERFNNFF